MQKLEVRTTSEIGESVEVSLVSETSGGDLAIRLEVLADAAALAVTLTDAGPDGHNRGPRNTKVVIRNPDGIDVMNTAVRLEDGRLAIVIPDPAEGSWTIVVRYEAGASAEINASSLKRGWLGLLGHAPAWLRCKTCKHGIKAFVIAALLIVLHPAAAAGAAVQAAASLNASAPMLFSVVADYANDALDDILQGVCKRFQLCD